MNEIFTLQIAVCLSVGLAVAWFAIFLLGYVWDRAWAWIDDSKVGKVNPVLLWVSGLMGYEYTGSYPYYRNKDGKRSDFGEEFLLLPLGGLASIPFAIYFYEISLFVLSGVVLAHLARYARRHKKVFDEHAKDPNAHSKQ